MSVIISVLIFSEPTALASPLLLSVAMSVKCKESVKPRLELESKLQGN